jgi:hypothetical protein
MDARWMPLAEAAERLGISKDAARKRAERGTLPSERRTGRLYVYLETTGQADEDGRRQDAVRTPLDAVSESVALQLAREEITHLRQVLEAEIEARRRADHLLAGTLDERRQLVERIEALTAGQDATVAANKGPGGTKRVDVGDDATPPATSPWSRFLRWLRGSEPSR